MTRDGRFAWALTAPALATIAVGAVGPVSWTLWESLHHHDLRMPWLGRPFVGLANYAAVATNARFLDAMAHTAVFTAITVVLELGGGLLLALLLDRVSRWRDLIRTAVLLPWAIPTVVAALVWRFLFESPSGLMNQMLLGAGVSPPTWFADPLAAWVPVIAADVWKMTPFVAVLLLAGLQSIDRTLYEAARMDGATSWRQFTDITLPLLRPALVVAFLFRTLDAFRVFDIVYVMTGGGPGTATEPIALVTFTTLLQNLRFGVGAAMSIVVFAVSFLFAITCIRFVGRAALIERVS